MKICFINSVNYGSTGNIVINIARHLKETGNDAYICIPLSRSNLIRKDERFIYIGNRISRNIHELLGYISGLQGFFSVISTISFLRKLDQIEPDIIHLNNLHSCYINYPLLFKYLSRKGIPVVWTFHDCYNITGKCPHFTLAKCDKWKTGCFRCPQLKKYPEAMLDATRYLWKKKKKWYSLLQSLTVITPSIWLEGIVRESILGKKQIRTIHHGIDLDVFKRKEGSFRRSIQEKYVVLGVSMTWGYSKGLDVFVELSRNLDERYRIVLVGADETTIQDKPENITIIKKTSNQSELADIYSSADVFVNPTREEVLGLVNIEALACGTPVVTFNTGGSPETIDDSCGSVVEVDDISKLTKEVERICNERPFSIMACRKRAEAFSRDVFFEKYDQVYDEIMSN